MNGSEFVRKLKRLGRKQNIRVAIESERGRGSHQTAYLGERSTVVKDLKKEIGRGLLERYCRDLGIRREDL
jgi:mRNA interferase HicA